MAALKDNYVAEGGMWNSHVAKPETVIAVDQPSQEAVRESRIQLCELPG